MPGRRACGSGRAASSIRSACRRSWPRRAWRSRTGPAPRPRTLRGSSACSRSAARRRCRPRRIAGAVRRALLFDLRNLGTLGLQQDSFPGLLWSDAIYGHATLSATALGAIPRLYAAPSVRAVLAESFARPPGDAAAIARGRALFSERLVGVIANRQILKLAPPAYAAAKLEGPILAPIDPTRPFEAKLAVRCADCHAGAPLENKLPLAANPRRSGAARIATWRTAASTSGRRSTRRRWTPRWSRSRRSRSAADQLTRSRSARGATASTAISGRSSIRRAASSPSTPMATVTPSGTRRPIGNAGGIGTNAWLAFDVARPEWPFAIDVATISDPAHAGHVGQARTGAAWVRAAPLVGLAASAPYLHNGSVPSLRALLEPPSRRPASFPLGKAGFVFDTHLPGNSNQGHDFGTALTAGEKADLVAFLESL